MKVGCKPSLTANRHYMDPFQKIEVVMNLLITTLSMVFLLTRADVSPCPSTHYLRKGSTGHINCAFTEGFFAVLWYNSTDIPNNEAVIVLQQSVKSGVGYESGEYDIYSNGSLVIENVTRQHNGTFTVLKWQKELSVPDRFFTTVIVVVSPTPIYPIIDGCDHDKYCIIAVKSEGSITCTLKGIRPLIKLDLRTFNEEPSIRFFDKKLSTTDNGESFDISLTVKCRVENLPQKQITAECRTVGGYGERFDSSTKFDVFIFNDECKRTGKPIYPADGITPVQYVIMVVCLQIVVFTISLTVTIVVVKVFRVRRNYSSVARAEDEEGQRERIDSNENEEEERLGR